MKKIFYFILLMSFPLFSCGQTKQDDLLEIPVDIDQNMSLPLSEIVDELMAIELELTDESLINPDRINRILLCGDYVISVELDKILVFGKDGKFVHSIGSKGQGPGEFTGIRSVASDEKNKRLFVNGFSKFICYDLMTGNCLKEISITNRNLSIVDMNYINDELFMVTEEIELADEKGKFKHSAVFRLNDDLQITDSCTIRNTYFERISLSINKFEDYILYGESTVYLYFFDIYLNMTNPFETVLRDTLYRLEQNHLIPELKLKFKNNGIDGRGDKFIQLYNMYRSSRYVFAVYHNDLNENTYRFCYDTKTGKGYNMQDGYTDDINNIEKRVSIRPLNTDFDVFYYWHTHMKPDDFEEPNPTLYIGKLKK